MVLKGEYRMSLAKTNDSKISEEEYLEGELLSDIRYEYINGYVYAMSGGTENHNLIAKSISREFDNYLIKNKSPCKTFSENMKVITSKEGTNFFYPDVFVVCDKHEDDDIYYKHSPVIIVEVLSKSTRKYDLTTKKLYYFNISTLQEYVIVEQDICQIEVFRKSDSWRPTVYFLGDVIAFESINVTVSVENIYYQVENDDITKFLKEKELEKK
jgi:Uma2 family endonuclease